ncbi:MAG: SGNH/GDSL hydrolase family protein [Geminicoccaceae bacterium]
MHRRHVLAAAALPALLVSARALTLGFPSLVAFGDSLSDNGNAGRFSDGPVWVEHLAVSLGVELLPSRQGGTNHAVGGALAAGGPHALAGQVRDYLAVRRGAADQAALHTVWAGGNDLLAAGFSPDPRGAAERAGAAVGDAVHLLVEAGARTILVPNLPDIGMTPALRSAGRAVAAEADRLSAVYRTALTRALDRAEAGGRATLLRLDVAALAARVLADPAAAGFTSLAEPCLGHGRCDGHLFWDSIHPTSRAHARLAAAALDLLGS